MIIGLTCPDVSFARSMSRYFGATSDAAEPHVRLDLHLVAHAEMPAVPNSLILAKTRRDDGFDIADELIRGYIDPRFGAGELHVKVILTNGPRVRKHTRARRRQQNHLSSRR